MSQSEIDAVRALLTSKPLRRKANRIDSTRVHRPAPAQKVVKNSAHGTVVLRSLICRRSPPCPPQEKGSVSVDISSSDTRIFAELVRIPKIRTPH
jgi:hypothetical protein